VTDELAVLVMIYKEVRPQAEDRVGQHLAKRCRRKLRESNPTGVRARVLGM
jgi:hypothetical protein